MKRDFNNAKAGRERGEENHRTIVSPCATTGARRCLKLILSLTLFLAATAQYTIFFSEGLQGGDIDLGREATDALFRASDGFSRYCPQCDDSHTYIYYRRVTPLPLDWSLYDTALGTWHSRNNTLNVDFRLYGNVSDMCADANRWQYCNYDDPNIGFPRDCARYPNSATSVMPPTNQWFSMVVCNELAWTTEWTIFNVSSVCASPSPTATTSASSTGTSSASASPSQTSSPSVVTSAFIFATPSVFSSATATSSVPPAASASGSPTSSVSASGSQSEVASASASISVSATQSVSADPPVQRLTASDGATDDYFGCSVSLIDNGADGYVALVGAYGVGANTRQGSAYIFTSSNGTSWTQAQRFSASGGASGDEFGRSVSLSSDGSGYVALLGAPGDANQGSAYIFTSSNGTSWTQVQRLTASDGAVGDFFGLAVSLNSNGGGYVALVGAYADDIGANANQGSAYIFTSGDGTNWTQVQRLTASDGAADDYFGCSVSITSNDGGYVALVGAFGDAIGANSDQGSAYIFTSSDGTKWTQVQRLTASDGAADDVFGCSVSITFNSAGGYVALVGAYTDDIGANSNQGSAYIFTSSNGSNWTQAQRLTALDGARSDMFGGSVSITSNGAGGYVALVGAYADDIGVNADQGSAYIFISSNGTSWAQAQRLTASDGAAGDVFGSRVSLIFNGGGYVALAGAYADDIGANANQGSAYIFTSSNGTIWAGYR